MNKGKIIDIQKKYVVVMNDEMTYEKIDKKNGLSLGKEIYYFKEDLYKESKQPVRKYFLVAAVIFMMLFIQPLLIAEEAYGYISLDINPSVELQVNKDLDVIAIEAMNIDAKNLVKDEWVGKSAKTVINLIIEDTKDKEILNKKRNFVLVSYYFSEEASSTEEFFVQSLDELFNGNTHDYEVAVIRSDAETHLEAKEANKSLGKQVVDKKMNTKVDDLLAAKESIEKDEDFKIYKSSNQKDEKQLSNKKVLEKEKEKNTILGETNNISEFNSKVESIIKENKGKAPMNRKAIEALANKLIGGRGEIIKFSKEKEADKVKYELEILYEEQIHEMEFDGFTGKLLEHEIEAIVLEDDESKGDNDSKDENKSKAPMNRKAIEAFANELIGGRGEIIGFSKDKSSDEVKYKLEILYEEEIHKIELDGFTGKLLEHEIEAIDLEDDESKGDNDSKDENKSKAPMNRKAIEALANELIGGRGEIIGFSKDKSSDEVKYKLEILYEEEIHKIELDGFTGKLLEHEIEAIDLEDDESKGDNDSKDENKSKAPMNRKAIEALANELIGGRGEIIGFSKDKSSDEVKYKLEILYEEEIHKIELDGFTGKLLEHEIEAVDSHDETDE